MSEGPQSANLEEARWLWETTRERSENDTDAFGLLLAHIVLELQEYERR
jgi:hypothetical protein